MNFEDLNAFVVVARQRSFSRASTELRVAVSALSKRVQRLEHAMGCELLVRHSKGVSLTSAGGVVLELGAPSWREAVLKTTGLTKIIEADQARVAQGKAAAAAKQKVAVSIEAMAAATAPVEVPAWRRLM